MMNNALGAKQCRSFGLLVGGIFGVIGLWPSIFRGQSPRLWAILFAGTLLLLAVLLPKSLTPVYRIWMVIGQALGWINTQILLGVVFYGLLTPLGLAMRILGKDPLHRQFDPNSDSYRVVRVPRPGSHMSQQY